MHMDTQPKTTPSHALSSGMILAASGWLLSV